MNAATATTILIDHDGVYVCPRGCTWHNGQRRRVPIVVADEHTWIHAAKTAARWSMELSEVREFLCMVCGWRGYGRV